MPSVIPFIPTVAFPILLVVRRPLRRWKRKRNGLCLNCGYNLAGAPEPRCPECGTASRTGAQFDATERQAMGTSR